MPTQRKIDTVTELTEKVNKAKSIVFADYRGLKHKQLEELRKLLKKVDSELVVAKNRLMKKALRLASLAQGKPSSDQTNIPLDDKIEQSLTDTTAILFAYADEVSPLKEVLKYFKTAGFGRAKAGLLGNVAMTESEVTKLSTLPSREMLLAQLVCQLNSPIQGLHYSLQWNLNRLGWALNSIKEKKVQILPA